MRVGSLFSGIGGLELGLEWAGLGPTVWQVERDKYCLEVLKRHWPDAKRYTDVKEVGKHNLDSVDVVCGGFPCQDISSAGKGAGLKGDRSGLWYEFERVVQEIRPSWVVVENVSSAAKRWVEEVCASLVALGYAVLPVPLSATHCGAPHIRRRVFIVAHSHGPIVWEQSRGRGRESREDSILSTVDGQTGTPLVTPWAFEPRVGRVAHGVPYWMDRNRALGNTVVPQCSQVIGHIIQYLSTARTTETP